MPRLTLLLLPGLLCDARLWRDQLAGLADVADPVVADLTLDSDVATMAARAIASVEGPFALAGLSMGGYVALEVMRRAPGRVERLALFDTSARQDTPEGSRQRRGLISLTRSGQFRGVTPRLLPRLLHERNLGGPLAGEVMEMAERVGREAFLRQQAAILGRPDSRGDLPGIAVPTMVVCGEADILTPPDLAREIAEGIPGAALHILPGCAHLPSMEEPERVTALMRDWLG
ncbi:alpha/beta fold hydrolase [Muricoccus pecuniae]|uniref:Pimeloyl-ACP methyl ester carboxylesterase n=1 Tax=Muricoccus pecuniae TaxID=693023 RepID=A0A840Y7L9_9PROT|nr:alpha/beta fold hydrolase [Roseomonas pecuniae]MBB5694759.1 pimeloyl-ACP methyl ester carboxylesterase [Roseomonas pecuniae]